MEERVVFTKKIPRKIHRKQTKSSRKPTSDTSDSEDEVIHKQARSRVQGVALQSKANIIRENFDDIGLKYDADRSATSHNKNDATREASDIDGHRRNTNPDGACVEANGIKSNNDKTLKKAGPMKAPANVRAISVIDYQPDVCKDYKQTGFCGFGDTCKFLHDRGDFKQSWQLDRDWESVRKTVTNRGARNLDETDIEEFDIPFKCTICKDDYSDPIITRCGHYFCEKCAILRYKKTATCAQCGNGTGGLFSGAKNLKEILKIRSQKTNNVETLD